MAARWYAIEVGGRVGPARAARAADAALHLAPVDEDARRRRGRWRWPPTCTPSAPSRSTSASGRSPRSAASSARAPTGDQIFRTRGAVIADFNGDGKMDLFLPQSGQTVGYHDGEERPHRQAAAAKAVRALSEPGQRRRRQSDPRERRGARGARQQARTCAPSCSIENKYKPRDSVKRRRVRHRAHVDGRGGGRLQRRRAARPVGHRRSGRAALHHRGDGAARLSGAAQHRARGEEARHHHPPAAVPAPSARRRARRAGRPRRQARVRGARLAVPEHGRQRRRRHPRVEGRHRRGGRRRALGVVLGGGGRRRSRRRSRRLRLQLSGPRLLRLRHAALRRQPERALPQPARRDGEADVQERGARLARLGADRRGEAEGDDVVPLVGARTSRSTSRSSTASRPARRRTTRGRRSSSTRTSTDIPI